MNRKMSDFQKDNVALMCDIGELVGLFDFEAGLDAFLAKAVSTVAWHMRAAVCSIYLYESESGKTDAYIACPNMIRDADECEHRFTLAPTMEVLVAVKYRKGLLPHWRDIQARLTQTLLSFRSTDASPHPSAQKE